MAQIIAGLALAVASTSSDAGDVPDALRRPGRGRRARLRAATTRRVLTITDGHSRLSLDLPPTTTPLVSLRGES